MTEKRFEFVKDGDKIYCRDVFDDFNYPMYDESTAKDIVWFMNFLYDEKKEVSKNFYRFYEEDYCNLEKENEQLKQQLDYADDLIHSHLSEHFIRQWTNFKMGHKEYNDFWEEKLKKYNELER